MTITQTPIVMKVQSEKYKAISYVSFIRNTEPESGQLNHIILAPMAQVSCIIKVKGAAFDDCDNIDITLAYKQTTSQTKRNKKALANMSNCSVFYRQGLETLISEYEKPVALFDESKPLLLNDLVLDKSVGDTAIQALFRFEKSDGSCNYILRPGGPYEQLSATIGMSIFEAPSIEEVLDSIIFNMSNLFVDNIIPYTKIQSTPALLDDIRRYLRFHFYGD